MPVTLARELFAPNAMRMSFIAPWTWAQYERARDKFAAYLEKVATPADLILDVRLAGENIPEGTFNRLSRSYADSQPKLRLHILVGAAESVLEMFAVAERYYGALGGQMQVVFVANLEEARALIDKAG